MKGMIKKIIIINLLLFNANIVFAVGLNSKRMVAKNSPVLVVSDSPAGDNLFLDLFFADNSAYALLNQQNLGRVAAGLLTNPEGGINDILLVNKHFNDLFINMAKGVAGAKGPQFDFNKPTVIGLEANWERQFEIKEGGLYEIWSTGSKLLLLEEDNSLLIIKDRLGDERKLVLLSPGIKPTWSKLAGIELEKGKHRMRCIDQAMDKRTEAVILPARVRDKINNLLREKNISYLFCPEIIKRNSGDAQVNLANNVVLTGYYVPQKKEYEIKAVLSRRRFFAVDKAVVTVPVFDKLVYKKDVKHNFADWNIETIGARARKIFDQDRLQIAALLNGNFYNKEKVVLSKAFKELDVKKTPYIAISFKLDDRSVQRVGLNLWIISKVLPRQGSRFPIKPPEAPWQVTKIAVDLDSPFVTAVDSDTYLVNIYEEIKKNLPDWKEHFLTKVDIALSRNEPQGNIDKLGEYNFTLSDFRFLKGRPVVLKNQPELFRAYSDHLSNYYVSYKNQLKRAAASEIPKKMGMVYRPKLDYFLDLSTQAVLDLIFAVFPGDAWMGEVLVEMGLDFNGDNKVDGVLKRVLPGIGLPAGKLMVRLAALDAAKEVFPDKKMYHLVNIGVASKEDSEILALQNVWSYNIRAYKESLLSFDGTEVDSGLLRIDNRDFNLPGDYKRYAVDDCFELSLGRMFLENGEHDIKFKENRFFKLERVKISPVQPLNSDSFPEIKVKKINPTRYVVRVKDAGKPFSLVLFDSFNSGWKAYFCKAPGKAQASWSALLSVWQDGGNRVEIAEHFVANGYANGWSVPARPQPFDIVVEYKPQRLLEIGLLVSGATLVGTFILMGAAYIMKLTRGKD